ncbi:MAG: glycosyltransferase [Phaeodactylibacter sp.]|nr:glycosyltransferase [Phaeodactylibacter sp.]
MKKVLIISPHFPPINGADMHRVRQSLPYFKELGWEPTVVAVDPAFVEATEDPLLLETVPDDIRVLHVSAFKPNLTRKLGLGSLALRSLYFYRKAVDRLLRKEQFDLIYFSTTQFPVLVLGNYWSKKFKVPYVIDMQDPWHSDYYLNKPKSERPPKYWFAYTLNKRLEPIAMKRVNGILSVSAAYHQTLCERYPNIQPEMCHTLTFGAFEGDQDLLKKHDIPNRIFEPDRNKIRLVYVGRAGHDMKKALSMLFAGIRYGLAQQPELFQKLELYFVGTSYAAAGRGVGTVAPLAEEMGLEDMVFEHTDRVPYFEGLQLLQDADLLFIPGSDDPKYTASKLYPYILAKKPLLVIFHKSSSVLEVLKATQAGLAHTFDKGTHPDEQKAAIYTSLVQLLQSLPEPPETRWEAFAPHFAKAKTARQVAIFEQALKHFHAPA